MTLTSAAVWDAKADNRHYSIRELSLPGFASTGPIRLSYPTLLHPHASGHVLLRAEDREEDLRVTVGQSIALEAESQLEMVNKSTEQLVFTVLETKG